MPPRKLHVILGGAIKTGALFFGENAHKLGRIAHPKLHGADALAGRQHGTGSNHAAFFNHRAIQHRGPHADKGAVHQRAGMHNGGMAHGDIITDDGGFAPGIHMHNRAILDIHALADGDEVGITAQHAVIPDIGLLPDRDIADHGGGRRDEDAIMNLRPDAFKDIKRAAIGGLLHIHDSAPYAAFGRSAETGTPSISPRFCTAAPDAPLPRLS